MWRRVCVCVCVWGGGGSHCQRPTEKKNLCTVYELQFCMPHHPNHLKGGGGGGGGPHPPARGPTKATKDQVVVW
jgi:hypothetical protein